MLAVILFLFFGFLYSLVEMLWRFLSRHVFIQEYLNMSGKKMAY
jgi:hypothetical protein